MFEDEASFWLDGTLHQTWSKVGVQPRVDTFGLRKTAHVYGAVSVEEALFSYQFSPVFNGHTFHEFLVLLVEQYDGRKVFLNIDNGPCHRLDKAGTLRGLALRPSWCASHRPSAKRWGGTLASLHCRRCGDRQRTSGGATCEHLEKVVWRRDR